jgi:hypothetical protein
MRDCVEKLSSHIGARPVGTDEEQNAAFFIEDAFAKETNFDVELQEFNAKDKPEVARLVPAAIVFLASVLGIVLPSLSIAWFLLVAVGVALFVLNELNIFSIARFLKSAPSQNVVAKHKPLTAQTSGKTKKVVLLTNYDTEKIRKEEASGLFLHLGKIKYFEMTGCACSLIAALVSLFAGANILCTILFVVGIVASLLPILKFIIHNTAGYNDGANNNAASVAVMLEVAKRISTGVYAPAGEVPVIHGQRAAVDAGVMPDGVDVSWDVSAESSAVTNSAVADLFFDKSRLTDSQTPATVSEEVPVQDVQQPVYQETAIDPQAQVMQAQSYYEPVSQATEAPAANYGYEQTAPVVAPEPVQAPAITSAPDWFTRGKEKAADKGNQNAENVKRSTYGDAMAFAENTRNAAQAAEEEKASNDLQKKLQAIHDQIEATSNRAEAHAETDAKTAEKVLDNEFAQEVVVDVVPEPQKPPVQVVENMPVPKSQPEQGQMSLTELIQEETKAIKENQMIDSESLQAEIPALKPLEPEYGVEVDPNEFLDKGKTEPLGKVAKEEKAAQEEPKQDQLSKQEPVAPQNVSQEKQTQKVELPALSKPELQEKAQPQNLASQPTVAQKPAVPKQRVKKPEPVQKRNIELPSLTGALDANKVNERLNLQTSKQEEKTHEAQSRLGINLPSLSVDANSNGTKKKENEVVSNVSAFGVGEATGTFAPITDEDLARANQGEEDMYVYDADDTVLQAETTESGAVAGPGYVDIPDTHTESIFGKLFHKKKKQEETSFSDSIGVDENWEARQVGKQRGDWSSFEDDDPWNGGAVFSGGETGQLPQADVARDEIYNFATNDIGAEVWCVALGAECADHAGLHKFLENYRDELKGARFITLDALGAGDLSIVEKEGVIKTSSIPTRMKRRARDAAKSAGITVSSEAMTWKETTSSELAKQGYKYIHVAGFEGGKPALLSSPNDSSDAVDDETMQQASSFVMEIIREL